MQILGNILLIVGSIFLVLGCLGILRMPDSYNRLQAGTKASTLGAFCTIIGVGILQPLWLPKILLIACFIMFGSPIANHMLGRAGKKCGVELCEKTIVDKSDEFYKLRGKE